MDITKYTIRDVNDEDVVYTLYDNYADAERDADPTDPYDPTVVIGLHFEYVDSSLVQRGVTEWPPKQLVCQACGDEFYDTVNSCPECGEPT